MTRTSRFLSGVTFGYLGQALTLLVGLWLAPFLLQRLGQHDYGLWLVGTQALAYLMLMDLGVVALLPRATAYAVGRAGDAEKADDLPEIIGQTARLVLWQTPLVVLAAALLWYSTTDRWAALRVPLGLVVAAFVLLFPLRIFQAVLQGLQDLAFLGRLQISSWLISAAATIGLVLAGARLEALAAGWALGQLLPVAICWRRLHGQFPGVLPRRLAALPWSIARTQLTNGFWASLMQIAVALVNATDLFIIGALLGPAAAVPYACTAKLISVLANQPQMLMQMAGPALSNLRVSTARPQLFQVCTALSQAMLLVSGGVVCVTLATNGGFVNWWVGARQYGGLPLTALLLLSMLLRHWNTTAVYSLFCFGHDRRISLTTLADGLVTTGAAAGLVWRLGPIGAPLGSLLGVCLVSLPSNLTALARENEVSMSGLLKPLWPWCWRFVFLAAVVGVSASNWMPATAPGIGGIALIVTMLYATVMLPTALRSALGAYLRPQLAMARMRLTGVASDVKA